MTHNWHLNVYGWCCEFRIIFIKLEGIEKFLSTSSILDDNSYSSLISFHCGYQIYDTNWHQLFLGFIKVFNELKCHSDVSGYFVWFLFIKFMGSYYSWFLDLSIFIVLFRSQYLSIPLRFHILFCSRSMCFFLFSSLPFCFLSLTLFLIHLIFVYFLICLIK